ncbi:MAG: DUF488 domain-containing protein [Candidatus Brockarchaeota archaeon]|nr:DUF488 domain-containing protein [Candidatus Brockarchaeota archaeon]
MMGQLLTVGHSTRSMEEFIELLRENYIQILVDVRRYPVSRRYPHFNQENLAEILPKHAVRYEWLGEELGGFRRPAQEDSPNKAWRPGGFRNYADYMMTVQFKEGVQKLLNLIEEGGVSLMCAERRYWRCHRRIISDYLTVKGHVVIHIVDKGRLEPHKLTSFARIVNGELRYPLSPS